MANYFDKIIELQVWACGLSSGQLYALCGLTPLMALGYTQSPSFCSSAAGGRLSDLLTDSDDSSSQSYDPNAVECVR